MSLGRSHIDMARFRSCDESSFGSIAPLTGARGTVSLPLGRIFRPLLARPMRRRGATGLATSQSPIPLPGVDPALKRPDTGLR
jgi:hypothetical protein